jgi:hypothetical protein
VEASEKDAIDRSDDWKLTEVGTNHNFPNVAEIAECGVIVPGAKTITFSVALTFPTQASYGRCSKSKPHPPTFALPLAQIQIDFESAAMIGESRAWQFTPQITSRKRTHIAATLFKSRSPGRECHLHRSSVYGPEIIPKRP